MHTTSSADLEHASSISQAGTKGTKNSTAHLLDEFPQVAIDEGTFKYVQIRTLASPSMVFIRGTLDVHYHSDVAAPLCAKLTEKGVPYEVPGGGRISRDDTERRIFIYGLSYGFGKADHSITADLCRKAFPGFDVTWSDEGY